MTTFNIDDLIKLPSACQLIKKNPGQYVTNPESPALDIASHLMTDALSLSAKKVVVQQFNDWFLVSAEKDWVRDNLDNIKDLSVVFSRLIAIPEKGINSFRGEVLAYAFSTSCFVYENRTTCVIKGDAPPRAVIDLQPPGLPFSVGFSI
ncbi:hypothetical protein [Rheinheimera pacifica]|uniref:hypothetical protein n=1 Tax=Rheinheimera pacifica TaxID=173990 RepID=UPI002ED847BD